MTAFVFFSACVTWYLGARWLVRLLRDCAVDRRRRIAGERREVHIRRQIETGLPAIEAYANQDAEP